MFMPIIVMLVGLSTILTIYVGGLRVLSGDLELGHIFQFVFYVNLLTWPFASVGWVTSSGPKSIGEPGAHQCILGCGRRTSPTASSSHVTDIQGRIDIQQGVGLTYPDSGIRALDKRGL